MRQSVTGIRTAGEGEKRFIVQYARFKGLVRDTPVAMPRSFSTECARPCLAEFE